MEVAAVTGSAVDYTVQLAELSAEVARSNQYLSELVECSRLVNVFFYILIACIVCYFGYKLFSWFF